MAQDGNCESLEEVDRLLWMTTLTALRDRWNRDPGRGSTEKLITIPFRVLDH